MLSSRKTAAIFAAAFCAGLAVHTQAAVLVNVCHGAARVLSQTQTDTGIDLEVEVNVTDCDGECIGSLEYKLLFVDADNKETLWHLTDTWNWRANESNAPFTLQLHQQALPNGQLKEIQDMQLGRCSCSTVTSD